MYNEGRGISQDYAQAIAWYRKAAAQGNANAQANLADMYETGKGLSKDYTQATIWYHKAALQGNAMAQYALGRIYDEGKGVPLDYTLAMVWFRKAAVQDYVRAQLSLGSMYEEGRGVPQDYVQAYKWYNLAAIERPHWPAVFSAHGKLMRDHLVTMKWITPPQVEQAQKLARQCHTTGYKDCSESEVNTAASPSIAKTGSMQSIPMKKIGTTYSVPVLINNTLTLDFTLDSGASDVSIPEDVVNTLVRTGTIEGGDFIGEQTYVLADGSKIKSRTFRIRSLKVGDRLIEGVIGSVAPRNGSLLLGQSFLSRFKSWSIDNTKHALLLE